MAGAVFTEMPKGGFSFELCKRFVKSLIDIKKWQ